MSIKQTYTLSIKNDAGSAVVADTTTYTADTEINVSEAVSGSSTKEIDVAVTVANIQSFFIESDQAVTVKFNSTSSPAAPSPLALAAKKAYWWNTDQPSTNPLTVDITKIYVTNAGTPTANFRCGFLVNQGV